MLEARITYANGKTHTIEATNLESLKLKCEPFKNDKNIYSIWVVELKSVGWIKNGLLPNLL